MHTQVYKHNTHIHTCVQTHTCTHTHYISKNFSLGEKCKATKSLWDWWSAKQEKAKPSDPSRITERGIKYIRTRSTYSTQGLISETTECETKSKVIQPFICVLRLVTESLRQHSTSPRGCCRRTPITVLIKKRPQSSEKHDFPSKILEIIIN